MHIDKDARKREIILQLMTGGRMNETNILVFGLDMTTDPARGGIAWGAWNAGGLRILETAVEDEELVADRWMAERVRLLDHCGLLLAVDAPLGWASAFQNAQSEVRAVDDLHTRPASFLKRTADRYVEQVLGERPLLRDPDKARQASVSALYMLSRFARRLGRPIPLVFRLDSVCVVGSAEVYPAGTLKLLGIASEGYEEPESAPLREEIVRELGGHMQLECDTGPLAEDVRRLNAVIAVLAGADILSGRADPPADPARGAEEGWIWLRKVV